MGVRFGRVPSLSRQGRVEAGKLQAGAFRSPAPPPRKVFFALGALGALGPWLAAGKGRDANRDRPAEGAVVAAGLCFPVLGRRAG